MGEDKKMTIRYNPEYEYHQLIIKKINDRDRNRYKTITDYVFAAVAEFEDNKDKNTDTNLHLSKEDREQICRDLVAALAEERNVIPGL